MAHMRPEWIQEKMARPKGLIQPNEYMELPCPTVNEPILISLMDLMRCPTLSLLLAGYCHCHALLGTFLNDLRNGLGRIAVQSWNI
jgi:hypothetical protein